MKHALGVLFLFIAALPFLAMGAKRETVASPPSGTKVETLVILSPHRREVEQEYDRGFADWMRERHGRAVRIEWLSAGGTSKLLKDLESRFAKMPDAPGVDLLFGGGVDPYLGAARKGWLVPVDVPPAILRDYPATCAGFPVYDEKTKLWFGVALSGFGILYNRPLLKELKLPEPKTWDDLGRPEYFSWIGSGDPRSSGAVHMGFEIVLQASGFDAGWGILTRLSANARSFGEGASTVPLEVAAGEIAAGIAIDQYARTVIDGVGGGRLAFVLPDRATVIGPDAIGQIRNGPSPELARLFVEYALCAEGQRILFQPKGANGQTRPLHRLPARGASYAEPDAPAERPYEFHAGFRYDSAKGDRRYMIVNDLMGVWLIDAHAPLAAAWKAVIAAGCPPELMKKLCAPPLTESELDKLAGAWKQPSERLRVKNEWAAAALARYAKVRVMAERGVR